MESQSLVLSQTVCPSSHTWCQSAETSDAKKHADPDSFKSRFKQLFAFDQAECDGIPLVCRGRLEK